MGKSDTPSLNKITFLLYDYVDNYRFLSFQQGEEEDLLERFKEVTIANKAYSTKHLTALMTQISH